MSSCGGWWRLLWVLSRLACIGCCSGEGSIVRFRTAACHIALLAMWQQVRFSALCMGALWPRRGQQCSAPFAVEGTHGRCAWRPTSTTPRE